MMTLDNIGKVTFICIQNYYITKCQLTNQNMFKWSKVMETKAQRKAKIVGDCNSLAVSSARLCTSKERLRLSFVGGNESETGSTKQSKT
jgi:hypothetical protein